MGLEKVAAKWLQMLRAGKLGEDSLKRLLPPGLAKEPAFQGVKYYMTPYKLTKLKEAPAERLFARWRDPDYTHTINRRFIRKIRNNLSNIKQRDIFPRYSSVDPSIKPSIATTGIPEGSIGRNSKEFKAERTWWATLPGEEIYDAERRIAYIPQFRGNPLLNDPRLRDMAMATAKHELGHRWHHSHPDLGDVVMSRLRKLFKFKRPLSDLELMEIPAHFRATFGNSRGAKAAINLPLQKIEELHPGILDTWRQQILAKQPNISDNLLNRLLATRAHLSTNYHVPV